uniref:Venom POBP 1 n=1 Tax=Oncocephalus sp. TaxID=2944721 RepID=A0AB38ZEU0_9HEMI
MYKLSSYLFIVIFSLLIYLIASQDVNDELWERAEKKCQLLSKLDSNEKASLLTSLGSISRSAKCYVNCFFEEVGLMNGADVNSTLLNTWLKEEAEISDDKEALYTRVKTCVDDIKATEKCDKAYELYICFENR